MTKRIVLCADDYGQAPHISEGILSLLKRNRLSAVSCMVTTEYWSKYAQKISAYRQQADIGLHLNLTEGRPISSQYRQRYGETYFSLPTLMKRSFLQILDKQAVYHEIEGQIQLFKDTTGFLPQFLDGHQHVHQFPVIRKIIIILYKKYFNSNHRVPIRLAYPKYMNNIKKIIIRGSGVFFKSALKKANILYNTSFSGVYNFHTIRSASEYRKLFQFFLTEIQDNGLMMCHPGLSPQLVYSANTDSIAEARYYEYQYLSSEAFLDDCLNKEITLEHFLVL